MSDLLINCNSATITPNNLNFIGESDFDIIFKSTLDHCHEKCLAIITILNLDNGNTENINFIVPDTSQSCIDFCSEDNGFKFQNIFYTTVKLTNLIPGHRYSVSAAISCINKLIENKPKIINDNYSIQYFRNNCGCQSLPTPTPSNTITPTPTPTLTPTITPSNLPCTCSLNVQFRTYTIPDSLTIFDENNNIIISTGPISTYSDFYTLNLNNLSCAKFSVCVDAPLASTVWDLITTGCLELNVSGGQNINNVPYCYSGCKDGYVYDTGSFSTVLANCEIINNVETVTNTFDIPVKLIASGSADDEILINGEVYEAGQYPFLCDNECGRINPNGAHNWNYTTILQPNESVIFGCQDNCGTGGCNGSWSLVCPESQSPTPTPTPTPTVTPTQ